MPGGVIEDFVQARGRCVKEVMTRDVASVTEETPLERVVSLMRGRRIKRVPVMRGHKLVGIVSRADLVRALGRILTRPEAALDDNGIRKRITADLEAEAWAPKDIKVTVEGGKVDLDGVIFDERDREAIRIVAENVPGVASVADHLIWVEPVSGMMFAPDRTETVDHAT